MLIDEKVNAEETLFAHLRYNLEVAPSISLDKDCFTSEGHAEIFRVLQQMGRANMPFNRKTLKDELRGRNVQLEDQWWEIFDRALPDNENRGDPKTIEHYGHLLRNYAAREAYHSYMESNTDAILDPHIDVRSLMQKHITKIASFQDKVTMDVDPSVEAIFERSKLVNPNPYYPSGLEAIDNNVKGLRAGHIWVLSAPYKSHKTGVALNIVAKQLREGKHVMYIALEDDDQAFLDKLVAVWGDIDRDEVLAKSTGGEDTPRVAKAREEVAHTNLRIYDAKKNIHNWKNLPALITADRMRFGHTDLVVVDYLQEYSVDYGVLQEIIPMIRKTAAEQEVCVVVISQMNNTDLRNQRFNSPSGQDGFLATKGTGDLGAACHVGIEIGRDLKQPGELMLTVKVARNGRPQRTFAQINEGSATITRCTTRAGLLKDWDDNDDLF